MLNNPYEAWNKANTCISEINEVCKALTLCLNDLDISTLHKLVIQGHLMQILESSQRYTEHVKPMLGEANHD
jgi:ribosomal 50S subunit-associated protein YjgA (DUF615 family)